MVRMGLATLIGVLMCGATARDAQAFTGFRCGTGRLVEEGDRPPEVVNRCGDPDTADTREEHRTVRKTVWTYSVDGVPIAKEIEVTVSVMIEEWTYDLGPNRFIRHLIFENGRLVRVWTTDRGSR
jgi:translation initiation factor 2B subunit (eIF-2B alpha/beta/delta family)